MQDPAARFAREAPGVDVTDTLQTSPVLHVYAGRIEDGPVRIYTPAPTATETDVTLAFERTARTWDELGSHPNVVGVHARGGTPRPWIAVDTDGNPLSDASTPLPVDDARTVAADVAEALRETTRLDASHTALAPENVRVVSTASEGIRARIEWPLDAVCRIAGGDRTPSPYTPPELLDDPAAGTERTDVYGLGGITYYAVTGQPPVPDDVPLTTAIREHEIPPASASHPDVPPALEGVLERALEADPEGRYPSCYEFKRAILFDASSHQTKGDGTENHDDHDASEERDAESTGEDDRDRSLATRRTALGALGLGALVTAIGGAWAVSSHLGTTSNESVPMFRYDAANTGHVPDGTGPTGGVREAWTFETNDGVFASPIVVEGTVYAGSNDQSMYALAADDGTEQWAVDLASPVLFSPAVVDGTVYLGEHSSETETVVYALDAGDGSERWTYEAAELGPRSPTVADGMLYVPGFGGIHALDPDTGSEQWAVDDVSVTSLSPGVGDGALYFGGSADTVGGGPGDISIVALEAEDGSERREYEMGGFAASSPAVVDDTVYVGGGDDAVYALATGDGRERWQFETGGSVHSSPAVAGGTVYVGSDDGHIYAIDRGEGTERWKFETDGGVLSSPAVVDGTVYVGSRDGNVYALAASDGSEHWRYGTDGEVISSPAVVDGTLYVGTEDGDVYALTEPTSDE